MDSQLRYNSAWGEWVVVSPKRHDKSKPTDLKKPGSSRKATPKSKCPFEDPQKAGNEQPYFWYPEGSPLQSWEVQVLPNKFPGLQADRKPTAHTVHTSVLYSSVEGYGHHDLLITRDHGKNIPDLSPRTALDVMMALRRRYEQLAADPLVQYISIFQNWGATAGGSLYHPHVQLIALPVVPSHIERGLALEREYMRANGACLQCATIAHEREHKERVVFENEHVMAFVPFAAQEPYELTLVPKAHTASFGELSHQQLVAMAAGLSKALGLVRSKLGDPDYNWYMHDTVTHDEKSRSYHHWHIQIIPKSNISSGFELGTGIEINPVLPEDAAAQYRRRG
jgi:UDPglucose--hexose-1-phosphate uridylyltransferase